MIAPPIDSKPPGLYQSEHQQNIIYRLSLLPIPITIPPLLSFIQA